MRGGVVLGRKSTSCRQFFASQWQSETPQSVVLVGRVMTMRPRNLYWSLIMLLASPLAMGADGPTPREIDLSVSRATKYLADSQDNSGAWRTGHGESCGITALSIMALMASGHVPGEGPYGAKIDRGIRWIIQRQHPSGLFTSNIGHGPMYEHGICTLMMAEVAGMTNDQLAPQVRDSLTRAIKLILKAQVVPKGDNHAGGWRYGPSDHDSDLSVTGWQLLALRAAKDVGCDVPAESIDYAVGYVKKCAARNRGGGFSYQPGDGVTPTRTGTGILCLEICGQHHAPETMDAAKYLRRNPLRYRDESFFFYGVYYGMIGMFQVGGDAWTETRNQTASILISKQLANGSWNGADTNEVGFGSNYCTSMAVLALAVEYQYLPIYQR